MLYWQLLTPRSTGPYDSYERITNKLNCTAPPPPPPAAVLFSSPLFSDGMILQRDVVGTKIWGTSMYNSSNATKTTAVVNLSVLDDAGAVLSKVSAAVDGKGKWTASLTTSVPAKQSTTVVASVSVNGAPVGAKARLRNVAFGDVLICGGYVWSAAYRTI